MATYLILHYVSVMEMDSTSSADQLGKPIVMAMLVGFAKFGQYIFPAAFTLGAVTSFLKNRKQQKQFAQAESAPSSNALFEMSWREFEGKRSAQHLLTVQCS